MIQSQWQPLCRKPRGFYPFLPAWAGVATAAAFMRETSCGLLQSFAELWMRCWRFSASRVPMLSHATARLLLAGCASLSLLGCASESNRVVLIPPIVGVDGTPSDLLRLGEPMKAQVYFWKDGAWVRSGNAVELPEGWLLMPPEPAK